VDAPVEGELQGAPVEASARKSAAARSGRHGGGRANRTWIRELMATQSGVLRRPWEENASCVAAMRRRIGWHRGVEALRLLPSGAGARALKPYF
jgi:hypothetical protein